MEPYIYFLYAKCSANHEWQLFCRALYLFSILGSSYLIYLFMLGVWKGQVIHIFILFEIYVDWSNKGLLCIRECMRLYSHILFIDYKVWIYFVWLSNSPDLSLVGSFWETRADLVPNSFTTKLWLIDYIYFIRAMRLPQMYPL